MPKRKKKKTKSTDTAQTTITYNCVTIQGENIYDMDLTEIFKKLDDVNLKDQHQNDRKESDNMSFTEVKSDKSDENDNAYLDAYNERFNKLIESFKSDTTDKPDPNRNLHSIMLNRNLKRLREMKDSGNIICYDPESGTYCPHIYDKESDTWIPKVPDPDSNESTDVSIAVKLDEVPRIEGNKSVVVENHSEEIKNREEEMSKLTTSLNNDKNLFFNTEILDCVMTRLLYENKEFNINFNESGVSIYVNKSE